MPLHRVYWTKHKVQKKKTWNDGFLSVGAHRNMTLYNEDMSELDSDFRSAGDITIDEEIDFTNYLVTVEELDVGAPAQEPTPPHTQQHARQQYQAQPAPQARDRAVGGAPAARPAPRPVHGRNLLRRPPGMTAPSVGVVMSAPRNSVSGAAGGGGGGRPPECFRGGVVSSTAGSFRCPRQEAAPAAESDAPEGAGERQPRYNAAYFNKAKRAKLFGDEEARAPGGLGGRGGSAEPSPGAQGGGAHGGWCGRAFVAAAPRVGRQEEERSDNDVLSLMGLAGDDDGEPAPAPQGGGATAPWGASLAQRSAPAHAHAAQPPAQQVPARAPAQGFQAPYGTLFKGGGPQTVPAHAPATPPAHTGGRPGGDGGAGGATHRVVYAQKGKKTQRWVPGTMTVDARGGMRLLSDMKRQVDSRGCDAPPVQVCMDAEVDFPHHTALVEELHVGDPAAQAQAQAQQEQEGEEQQEQQAPAQRQGNASWDSYMPQDDAAQPESTTQEAPAPREHAGGPGGGGGRGGFFALMDRPNESGQRVSTFPAPGAGGRSRAPAFSAPRAAPAREVLSLKEENQKNLAMDREVQKRFKENVPKNAAGAPPPQPGGAGGRGVLVRSAVRSGVYLSNTRELGAALVERAAKIPDTFRSFQDYRNAFVAALEEEVTLRLRDAALALYRAMQDVAGAKGGVLSCRCGTAASVKAVSKDGPNKGRTFFTCTTRKCNFFKWTDDKGAGGGGGGGKAEEKEKGGAINILIDTSAPPPDLRVVRQRSQLAVFKCTLLAKAPYSQKKHRAQQEGPRALDNATSFLVRVSDEDAQSLAGTAKNDLWVVSSSPYFSEDTSGAVAVARSVWFSRGSDGCVELARISGAGMPSFRDQQTVYCLRGPNIHGEWDMLENLKCITPHSVPLIPFLLSGLQPGRPSVAGGADQGLAPESAFRVDWTGVDVDKEVARTVKNFSLNDDQRSVLVRFAKTLQEPDTSPPAILVHGVFGSGKSTLLVAIILFAIRVLAKAQCEGSTNARIIVSSATNVALDNILQGLVKDGYEDFVRVGCLKRIAKPILKYTLRETGSDDRIEKESVKELNEMLRNTRDAKEIFDIKAAITQCQAGKMRDMKRMLASKRVVGVTCASSGKEVLERQSFDICILDECSQFIEPLSLLPVSRFSCKILLAAGDPMQLPPTVCTPSAAEATASPTSESVCDISKTLFSRLVNCGVEPTMLRTQYRCHPTIGSAASDLFYEGGLINGCTDEERQPLIEGIPAILFVDTEGSRESMQDSGSYVNQEEARFCTWFVSSVVGKGLQPSQIGVICAYKAQVDAVQKAFEAADGCLTGVQVSTVDAFQGGEKDIIVVSSCRTEALGFLKSHSRMNVAITRARRHLVLVGCGRTLPTHECWKVLIDRARAQPGGFVGCRDMQMRGELALVAAVAKRPAGSSSESEEEEEETAAAGRARGAGGGKMRGVGGGGERAPVGEVRYSDSASGSDGEGGPEALGRHRITPADHDDDDYDFEEEQPAPPPRKRAAPCPAGAGGGGAGAHKRSISLLDDDDSGGGGSPSHAPGGSAAAAGKRRRTFEGESSSEGEADALSKPPSPAPPAQPGSVTTAPSDGVFSACEELSGSTPATSQKSAAASGGASSSGGSQASRKTFTPCFDLGAESDSD